jgi:DNA-directed RNA polymerase subunit alpha
LTLTTEADIQIETGASLAPEITTDRSQESYGRFIIEPLSQGFGVTLGNAIRRVLLNSLPGVAITAVRIEGTQHEYSTLPHVREDMVDFLLNVKDIRIQSLTGRPGTVRLDVGGREGPITAGDIQRHGDYTIVNPDLVLLNADSAEARVSVEFTVEQGTGFRAATTQVEGLIGVLPVDAIFTPIRRANFEVEATRVGQVTDFDKLILEIWTDGTISPEEAVRKGTQIIIDQLQPFAALGEPATAADGQLSGLSVPDSLSSITVEDLRLSTRTQNSLRRGNLATVGHVLERSPQELLDLRNFGEQSLNELIDRLRDLGVPVPESDDDRAWRRLPLAALVPAAEDAASAGDEQPQAGEGDEDGQAVYSMRPDEDIAEVDLTHYSRRSFAPDEEEEEQE